MNFAEFQGKGWWADARSRWYQLFKEGEQVQLDKEYKHMATYWPKGTPCTIAHIGHWQVVLVFPDNSRMVLSPEDIAKL